MKVSFTVEKIVTLEKQINLELKTGFSIKSDDERFNGLLKHINDNFKFKGSTTTYKSWNSAYGKSQGGSNMNDLARIDVIHTNHNSIALKIYWRNESDFAVVILEEDVKI